MLCIISTRSLLFQISAAGKRKSVHRPSGPALPQMAMAKVKDTKKERHLRWAFLAWCRDGHPRRSRASITLHHKGCRKSARNIKGYRKQVRKQFGFSGGTLFPGELHKYWHTPDKSWRGKGGHLPPVIIMDSQGVAFKEKMQRSPLLMVSTRYY